MSNQKLHPKKSIVSSVSEEKKLSFEGSLYYLKDDAFFELLEDVEYIESYLHKLEQTISPSGKNWRSVLKRIKKIKDVTSNEAYERDQLYKSELEELEKNHLP